MKILKKILIFLVVLVGLVLIVSAFLPGSVVVSRSRVMPISKQTAFEKVTVLQTWKKWMTWAKLDSNAVYTYSAEPAVGKGAWYSWKGNDKMGEGKMTITEVFGTDSVYMDLVFADYDPTPVVFKFFEKDKGTEVFWSMRMDFPYYMRIMGLFVDGMMAADFEGGLEGIEKLGINEPASSASAMKFTVEESKEMNCLCMTDSCIVDAKTIGEKYEKIYAALEAEMKAQKLEYTGAPFSINERYDEAKNFLVFSPGIPVSGVVKQTKNKNVKYCKCEPQKVLVYDYFGDYSKMQPAYGAMYKHIGENKMEVAGNSWEEYITDPMKEADTAKWNTKIYIPIK